MPKSQNTNKKEIIVVLNNIRSSENVGSIFRTCDAVGVSKIILAGYTPSPIDRFGRENKGLAKASLGAEKSVAWGKMENLKDAICILEKFSSEYSQKCTDIFLLKNSSCSRQSRSQGISGNIHSENFLKNNHSKKNSIVIGIEQSKNSVDYKTLKSKFLNNKSKLVLVFGNEVEGLSKEDLKLCDIVAELPMRGAMVRQAHHPSKTKQGKESLNVAVCTGIVLYELINNQ